MPRYVIVGSGVAGVTAAQTIVRSDPGADVVLLGCEPHPYYQRPRLWALIADEIAEHELFFRPAEWYAEQGIRLQLDTTARELDPAAHQLTLADGTALDYDRLLLATGGVPFVPPIEGTQLEGVFPLRTLQHAREIKAFAERVDRALIIGGGLLGLETARALLRPHRQVAVLEIVPHLLPRQLDAPGAALLTHLLERMGLEIIVGRHTQAILGDERVQGVRFADETETRGNMVVLSTGIRSRIELAHGAGLAVNRGIVIDDQLRTSAEDVFAAGDAAEFDSTVYGIIPAAIEQARAAAMNMIERGAVTYKGTVPSTTLKIVGIDLTCLGESTADGEGFEVVRRTDRERGIYRKVALRDGKIVGAILLGDLGAVRPIQQLISSQRYVAAYAGRLLDKDLDLRALARGETPG
jgi:NAD(P)H-nitrite reductase large subunit